MIKRKINIYNAVGTILAHDLTEVTPGRFSGAAFRKGHLIRKQDILKLLKIGKEHIWALKLTGDEIHEDAAAEKFRCFAGRNISYEGPSEGKILFIADTDGLLIIDRGEVDRINAIGGIVFSTFHSLIPVKKDDRVAGIRIVPLALSVKKVNAAVRNASRKKPVGLIPFKKKKIAVVITGSEVASGIIKDKFGSVMGKKAAEYGCEISQTRVVADDERLIVKAIEDLRKKCDILVVTGGMSVDPDDVTRRAIKKAGTKIVQYGIPVMPGNMTLVGYLGNVAVIGMPACALHRKRTVFDLLFPMLLADCRLEKKDLLKRGYGGFCSGCDVCDWPKCAFGKC